MYDLATALNIAAFGILPPLFLSTILYCYTSTSRIYIELQDADIQAQDTQDEQ